MKVQCRCGGAYVGWSKRAWVHWMDNHACVQFSPSEAENEQEGEGDESEQHDSGYPAQTERSYQYNGYYDGDRHLPEIQARSRQPFGFTVE